LYFGNRNYSSWSLRAWLCLRWAGIAFDETVIELDQPGYGGDGVADVLAVSPSGRVPVLDLGAARIWDSLAIAEWAAENHRAAPILPEESLLRAQVRSAAAEMHSGFAALRRDLPMNIRRRCSASGLPRETLADIERIDRMWSDRRRADGEFLFGRRSLADAFYVPVATRFRTYSIALSAKAQAYCDTLLSDGAFRQWEAAVLAEPAKRFSRANFDELYQAAP
jgi:glutathione S-transferase